MALLVDPASHRGLELPDLGGMAESRIVPGVLRRLDIEAAAINEHLAAA